MAQSPFLPRLIFFPYSKWVEESKFKGLGNAYRYNPQEPPDASISPSLNIFRPPNANGNPTRGCRFSSSQPSNQVRPNLWFVRALHGVLMIGLSRPTFVFAILV
jgi:hypothetical protein